MKKLVSVLLLGAMLCTISGCGDNATQSTSSGGATGTESSKSETSASDKADAKDPYAPIEGKKYKFTLAPYQKAPVDENAELVKYYEEKYGVEFEILNIDSQKYPEVLGLKFASGEIPDVVQAGGNNMSKWAAQGVLAELDEEVLSKYAPLAYQYSIDASPNVFRLGRVNGKLYGLAEIPVSSAKVRYNPCVWRGDWLEKLGISKLPETLEEYEAAFYKIAKEDPDGNGKKDTYGLSKSGFPLIFGAYGMGDYNEGIWIEKDNALIFSAIQPETKEVVQKLAKWYQDGVIDPEFITGENTGGYWAISHAFINGKIGFTGHGGYGHWAPPVIEGGASGPVRLEFEKLNPTAAEKMAYANPPVGPNGFSGSYGGGQSNPVIGNVVLSLGANLQKEPDRMGKLLQVFDDMNWGSQENAIIRSMGFQGKQWEYDKDGIPRPIGAAKDDPMLVERMGAAVNFRFFGPEDFPNSSFKQFTAVDWALKNGHDKGILKRGNLPSVTTEAEKQYKAELDKIIDEAFIEMITGKKPIDYFDTFVQEWRAKGGDQIEKEVNEWYKEFWGK